MRVDIALESNYASTRSKATVQQTLNMFPESQRGYRDYPGLVEYASFLATSANLQDSGSNNILDSGGNQITVSAQAGGSDRGAELGPSGLLYEVSGPSLFSISSLGASTYLGAIAGTVPVVMAYNGTQLIIAAGANKYVYTTSGGLAAISDGDLDDAYSVAYLDSRFIYDQPTGFATSVVGDGTDINALDYAAAEAFPDAVLRVYTINQLAYFFGEESTEIWFSSGVGRPPLDRQVVLEHGIAGRYAIDSIDDNIYMIDHKKRPAVISGQSHMPLVQQSALGEEWVGYGDAAYIDARVQCYSLQHENFADFIFPAVSKVWTYHQPSQTWFEKAYASTTIIKAFNVALAADATDRKLYKLDFDNSQIKGSDMQRRKDLPLITSEVYGAPGREMVIDDIRIHFDIAGSADVTLSVSKDLTTFTTIGTKTISGNQTVAWRSIGKCRELITRLEVSNNTKISILDASMDAEVLDD